MTGYGAGEVTAWLEANTPEAWCWQLGYHPAHGGCQGRGPGMRRLALTLLLPEKEASLGGDWLGRSPRIYEEMEAGPDASYLLLAQRAVRRAKPPGPGEPVVVPALGKCPKCGANPGIVCRQPSCGALAAHNAQQAMLRQTLQRRDGGPGA